MIVSVQTFTTIGIEGYPVSIEVDSSKSLPGIDIVGLPDVSIKEAKERVRATFRNVGLQLPPRRIIINLSPSDLKKYGTRFDLPIAFGILQMLEETNRSDDTIRLSQIYSFGELGLDGAIKEISGLLPSVVSAVKCNEGKPVDIFCSISNAEEVVGIPNVVVYAFSHFSEVVDRWQGKLTISAYKSKRLSSDNKNRKKRPYSILSEIKGHAFAKRALLIAAAGGHNILMIGAPGSGKSMLAKALVDLIPPLTFEEQIEVSQIYSVAGKLDKDNPLITEKPFRAVHHTASSVSIIGGGSQLLPGEISLSHRGILFFDELPEFKREVLETLRQPLEEKSIIISRASGSAKYPANFMFVAAMNPCPCGYYKDPQKNCNCSLHEIRRYQSKISGPLLDRFDLILEVPRETIDKVLSQSVDSKNTNKLLDGLNNAFILQKNRFAKTRINNNADMNTKQLSIYAPLHKETKDFFLNIGRSFHFSPRVMHRMIKISRTIADISNSQFIEKQHLAEALQYRSKNMFIS